MRYLPFVTTMIVTVFAASAQAETLRAAVSGMHCAACAQSIEALVGEEAAVKSITVDVKAGTARVVEKPGQHLDDATFKALVEKAGYQVTELKRSAN